MSLSFGVWQPEDALSLVAQVSASDLSTHPTWGLWASWRMSLPSILLIQHVLCCTDKLHTKI